MADTPKIEDIVGALPEEHRDAVKGAFEAITDKYEGDITNLKSSHDTAFQELKTRFDSLEMESVGLRDKANGSGGGSIGDSDLTESQKALKSRREQEQAEAERQKANNELKAQNEQLEARLFERAKADAKADGVPEAVINLSENSQDLERQITMYKAISGNGDGSSSQQRNLGTQRGEGGGGGSNIDGADAMGSIIDSSIERRNAR